MTDVNRQWRLARHAEPGELLGKDNFRLEESPIPKAEADQLVVRTLVLGTSPAQRSYISKGLSMHQKLALGDVMRGRGVAVVSESRHENFKVGDIVTASTGWQDYAVISPGPIAKTVFDIVKIRAPLKPYSLHLGVLGGTGAAAYFGLRDVGQLKSGDTLVVSAAAGGVGATAGQIGKVMGCRVIGIAGTDEKCRWVTETLGFDACINYRTESVDARLSELAPDGLNVFFDNVGGEILNTALAHLAVGARIVICGFIATDYASGPQTGPANYTNLVRRRAKMEGFFVFDYNHRMIEAEDHLRVWYNVGRLNAVEDIDQGLEHMPETLGSLFAGTNKGIKLCRVAEDP